MKKKLLIFIALFALFTGNVYAESITLTIENEYSGENEIISDYDGDNTIGDLISYVSSLSKFEGIDNMVLLNSNHILLDNSNTVSSYCMGSSLTVKAYKLGDSTDKSYTINAVEPANNDEMIYLASNLNNTMSTTDVILTDTCNSTYTVCSSYNPHSYTYYKDVEVNYVYDADVKNKIDSLITEEPDSAYYITDMYSVSFYADGNSLGSRNSKIALYSKEFGEYINYANLRINLGQFMGGSNLFSETNNGYVALKYNDVIYKLFSNRTFTLYNVIYVSEDTNESDYVTAIKARLDASFSGNDYTVTDLGDISAAAQTMGLSENVFNNCISEIETSTNSTLYNHVYKITINGNDTYFFVSKNNSKITNASFKSIDAITNISVDTDSHISNEVSIVVNSVSSNEKTRLFKLLNISDGESFDIKLKYDGIDSYVTSLSNGSFLVRIPVPTKYNGKDLVVYYVSEDDTIEEHEVTVLNGYALFITDHFSIYTLTEKVSTTNDIVNPNTGDNIYTYITLLFISTVILSLFVFNKKRFN